MWCHLIPVVIQLSGEVQDAVGLGGRTHPSPRQPELVCGCPGALGKVKSCPLLSWSLSNLWCHQEQEPISSLQPQFIPYPHQFPTATAPLRVRETINSNVMLVDKCQINNGIISFLLQFFMRSSRARAEGIFCQLWGSLEELLGLKMFSHLKAAQKSLESSLKGKFGTPKVMANEVKEGSIQWLGSH